MQFPRPRARVRIRPLRQQILWSEPDSLSEFQVMVRYGANFLTSPYAQPLSQYRLRCIEFIANPYPPDPHF